MYIDILIMIIIVTPLLFILSRIVKSYKRKPQINKKDIYLHNNNKLEVLNPNIAVKELFFPRFVCDSTEDIIIITELVIKI